TDTLIGGTGNDTLDGGAGIDNLTGGKGDDTYIVDNAADTITELANEGNDTVQSANLSLDLTKAQYANVENAALTGSAALNLTGNSVANTLTGNDGNNTLDGG